MKYIFLSNFVLSVCVLYMFWPAASAQYFYNPRIFYKPMTFEKVLRGMYNMSRCIADLLECWEHMSADVICDARDNDHETYCSINKMYCDEEKGYHYSAKFRAHAHNYIALSGHCFGRHVLHGYGFTHHSPKAEYTK